ncbi:MAG: Ig domain-containing protein [Blautia hansenii]
MNHIEIKYSYFSQKAELMINGEQASPYSKLVAILNRPFLEALSDIIPCLDNEIFDEYDIDLYSSEFQYELLIMMAKGSEYCKNIRFFEIESLLPKKELVEQICYLGEKNNIFVERKKEVKVYFSNNENMILLDKIFVKVDTSYADIGVFEENETIPETVKIPLVLSESFKILQKSGRTCYFIPIDKIELFWEFYLLEFVERPVLMEYLTALRYAKLEKREMVEFNAIKNNKPNYYIENLPDTLEKNEKFIVEFESFPTEEFYLKIENEDIAEYYENIIWAKKSGTTSICICNKKDEVIVSNPIMIVEHQYVEEIRLVSRFEYLKKGERNRIDMVVTPLNAEDANRLVWKVSDPNILQIDRNGNIIALEEGKAIITVSGYKTMKSLVVEVRPSLQEIYFTQQSIRLKNRETAILECNIKPSGAPTENLIWELDNKTIASINPSKYGYRCQVIASGNYEGKGNVRCYDPETKLGAICNIEVISKIKQGMAEKIALWCWILGIIIPFLLPISAFVSACGFVCDPEKERRPKYGIYAIASILTFIFRLLSDM